MAKLRSYRYLCWWYSPISDVDPSSTKKRSELTDVALLESRFSQPIARTLAHRNNASQAQILRRQIWNNCAHQNCACKYTGNFFGFLLGLKRSALPLISTFQTPAGPKESYSHLGLTILWIPSTLSLAGDKRKDQHLPQNNESSKNFFSISAQGYCNLTFSITHLATCDHSKPRRCFIATYITLCDHQ